MTVEDVKTAHSFVFENKWSLLRSQLLHDEERAKSTSGLQSGLYGSAVSGAPRQIFSM